MEELQTKLTTATEELRALNEDLGKALSDNDLEKAKECRALVEGKQKEVEALKADIKVAEEKRALEDEKAKAEEELRVLKSQIENSKGGNLKMETRSFENALVEIKKGATVSNRAINVAGVGTKAVIPETFIAELEALKAGYGALKPYTHVIPVSTLDGRKPVHKFGGKLTKITAGNKLDASNVNFTEIKFNCEAYGDLVEVDNQLMEDSALDIFGIVREEFAGKAAASENNEILEVMATMATKTLTLSASTKTAIDQIVEAKMGYKPAVRRGMCVFATAPFIGRLMNESIVDGKRDERVQIVNGVMYVDNMEVVEIDTDQMNTTDAADVVAYLGNPHAIKFFDRKTIEIAMSTEVMFEYNAKAMRVIERFDVVPVDDEMLKFTKIK